MTTPAVTISHRPSRAIPFLIVALSIVTSLNTSAAADAASSAILVRRVKLSGVKNVKKAKLANSIIAQPAPRWKFWKPRLYMTVADLDDDLQRIRKFYRLRGYYQAEADYQLTELGTIQVDADEKGLLGAIPLLRAPANTYDVTVVSVRFRIQEGPAVKVDSIGIDIETPVDGLSAARLEDLIPLKPGTVFAVTRYRETISTIKREFRIFGYPTVMVDGNVDVKLATNEANLSFRIRPGPRFYFGPVSITGNDGYLHENVLRRALLIEEGEPYSEQKIDASLRNLYNLDVFKVATITPEITSPNVDTAPITVEVKPGKRWSMVVGAGYGNEDGPRFRSSVTYRNLLERAGKLTLSLKRSDITGLTQLEYGQPYIFSPKNSLSLKIGHQRDIFESHTVRNRFVDGNIIRRLSKRWVWNVGYNLDISDLEELKTTDAEEVRQFLEESDFLISSVTTGLSYDSRDNELNPRKGSTLTISIAEASELLGSEVDYFQSSIEVSSHKTIAKRMTLAGRLRLQALIEMEDTSEIPIFKRFFLGGGNTVRGYGYQKLGPLDVNGNPLGGLSAAMANIELRFPIVSKLSGVFFLDTGTVARNSFHYDFSEMKYSCGTGLRYDTPIGPIRFDFGYKLNPPTKGDFGNTTAPDAEIEDRWKIHLSIGQAF